MEQAQALVEKNEEDHAKTEQEKKEIEEAEMNEAIDQVENEEK